MTLLHCPALTEIDSGKSLLEPGFAVDGKVRPVGTLVGARQPPAPASAGSRPHPPRPAAARTRLGPAAARTRLGPAAGQ